MSQPHFGVSGDTPTPVPADNDMLLDDIFQDFLESDFTSFELAPLFPNIDDDEFDESEKKKRKTPSSQGGAGNDDLDKMERRERNREHAKRSRIRKKLMQESLQQSVNLLEKENKKLREAITSYLGPEAINEVPDTNLDSMPLPEPGRNSAIVQSLQTAQQNFCITDPSLADNPIVYASHGFLTLTGYTLDQVLGRNCRFLQGPHTDSNAIDILRRGIHAGEDVTTVILNYRADGQPFWNQLYISALKDGLGNVVNFLGVSCKVSDLYAEVYLKNEAEILGSSKMQKGDGVEGGQQSGQPRGEDGRQFEQEYEFGDLDDYDTSAGIEI